MSRAQGRAPADLVHELIQIVCWTPVLAFTRASLRQVCAWGVRCTNTPAQGVFAWSWVIAARPHMSLSVLSEMNDAWCWVRQCVVVAHALITYTVIAKVIEQRRGLFARYDAVGAVDMLGRAGVCV
jgi:hypothetical protein